MGMVKGKNPTLIVFDLEATCWDRGENAGNWNDADPNYMKIDSPTWKQVHEMETIEIGAVKLDIKNYEIIDQFQTFIRPILNPELTDFCKKLTTITQKNVSNAPDFKEAFMSFRRWAGRPFYYVGWGQYDYRQLRRDCDRCGVGLFSEDRYLNGKDEYFRFTGKRAGGLGKAVRRHNLTFEGTHHRAISDAIMTAKVLQCARKELEEKMGPR